MANSTIESDLAAIWIYRTARVGRLGLDPDWAGAWTRWQAMDPRHQAMALRHLAGSMMVAASERLDQAHAVPAYYEHLRVHARDYTGADRAYSAAREADTPERRRYLAALERERELKDALGVRAELDEVQS